MADYTDRPWLVPGHMYQYDIGWLVDKILSFEIELNTAIDLKTIHYADPIQWDITTQYAPNTVVVDPKTGTAYMSKAAVPSGILLTNTDYWVVIFNYQRIYDKIMSGVAFNDKDNLNASKDLQVNDLVWYGGELYRVTRTISEGALYIPGTNITPTTIESLLSTYYGRDRVSQVLNDTYNVSGDFTVNAGDISETAENLTLHSTKDTLIDADGKLTEQIAGSREIDVDGDDSLHVDGVTSINRGGAVTEVYGSSVDKRVAGAFTENFEDTVTSTFNGKHIIKANDETRSYSGNLVINDFNITKSLPAKPVNALSLGFSNDRTAYNDEVFARNAGIPIYFPAGVYKFKNPITIYQSIYGVGATPGIESLDQLTYFECDTDDYAIKFADVACDRIVKGIVINVPNGGGIEYSTSAYSACRIDNVTIGSVKTIGINIAPLTLQSRCMTVDNCQVFGGTLTTNIAYKFTFNAPDCRLTNSYCGQIQIGLRCEANIITLANVHLWNGLAGGSATSEWWRETKGLSLDGCTLSASNLYLDTQFIPIFGTGKTSYVYIDNLLIWYDDTIKTADNDGSFMYGQLEVYIKNSYIYPSNKLANIPLYDGFHCDNFTLVSDSEYNYNLFPNCSTSKNVYDISNSETGYCEIATIYSPEWGCTTLDIRSNYGDIVTVNISIGASTIVNKVTLAGALNMLYKIENNVVHVYLNNIRYTRLNITAQSSFKHFATNYNVIRIDRSKYVRPVLTSAEGLTAISEKI